MTIDERLEALKRSLELWSQMRTAARKEYEEWSRSLDEMLCANEESSHANKEPSHANEEPPHANEEPFRGNEERLAQLMDTKARLGRILEKHGQRLDNLESH
jgi:hypothetical protein